MSRFVSKGIYHLLGILALAGVALAGVVVFVWNNIYQTHAENTEVLHELAHAQARVDQLATLRSVATAIENERTELDQYIVRESDVIHLLDEIERLGLITNTEITIENVEATEGDLSAELVEVPVVRISILVTGSWSGVMDTVALLELLPKQGYIPDVRMALEAGTRAEWSAAVTMLLPRQLP